MTGAKRQQFQPFQPFQPLSSGNQENNLEVIGGARNSRNGRNGADFMSESADLAGTNARNSMEQSSYFDDAAPPVHGSRTGENRNRSSRVPGRGRLLFSLRALLQRTEKFLSFRATPDEQRWAGRLHDELSATYAAAVSASGCRQALEAVDKRRTASRKTRAGR